MTYTDQIAQLKQQAITILIEERDRIDTELSLLGHGKENPGEKRRGRPPKQPSSVVQPDTNRAGGSSTISNTVSDTPHQAPVRPV